MESNFDGATVGEFAIESRFVLGPSSIAVSGDGAHGGRGGDVSSHNASATVTSYSLFSSESMVHFLALALTSTTRHSKRACK